MEIPPKLSSLNSQQGLMKNLHKTQTSDWLNWYPKSGLQKVSHKFSSQRHGTIQWLKNVTNLGINLELKGGL